MTTSTDTPTGTLVDTSVMPTLHSFFRRELRLAPEVVRGVTPGDTRRARVVADHIEFLLRALHHHHTVEDRLLWPPLLELVPDELAPIVHLMESQHERVEGLIAELHTLLSSFRATVAVAGRDHLADVLQDLHDTLVEHLDAEEQRLLPIAARTLTQVQWDAMGEAGREGVARKDMTLAFGMFAYEGDPAVIAGMLAEAPPPVRFVVSRLSRRAFRKHALRVHGTATP